MAAGGVLAWGFGLFAVTVGVSGAAPILLPPPSVIEEAAGPRSFADCSALTDYVRPQAAAEFVRRMREWAWSNGQGELEEQSLNRGGGRGPLEAIATGPTGTNVQEPGADEPDTSKLDGNRLVTIDLQNGERDGVALRVLDVGGERAVQLGLLWLPAEDRPEELLVLADHRALVLGATSDTEPRALLTLVDLSDPGHPAVLRRETVTGDYVSARLVDGVVRVAIAAPSRATFEWPDDGDSQTKALGRGLKTLRVPTGTEGLPAREITRGDGTLVSAGPLLGCSDVRAPARFSGLGLISLLTIDTARGAAGVDAGRAVGVLGSGDLVYASTDRLYVATTVPDFEPDGTRTTEIHAFDATGRVDSPYVGSGAVPGAVLGRWAFSEHEGFLRVATTMTPPWAAAAETATESGVTVLAERNGRLARVGGLSGLGPGEFIRGVRWLGERAVVVTYAMTDPLYLLDLADPTAPRPAGALKLSGYSAYLHPVGDDHLLALGQDGDSKAQASSFDLGLAQPARLAALDLGAGFADAEGDESRAFVYLPDRRLAVFPFSEWHRAKNGDCAWVVDCSDGGVRRSVAVAITVNATGGLTETGRYVAPTPLLRVLRSGDRLVAVSSAAVTMLDPDGLRVLGSTYATTLNDTPDP